MLEDDKPNTPVQQQQVASGQYLALSVAVRALIATHPNPKALAASMDQYAEVTARIFLLKAALQADDGMRQAYSETLRGLVAALPSG